MTQRRRKVGKTARSGEHIKLDVWQRAFGDSTPVMVAGTALAAIGIALDLLGLLRIAGPAFEMIGQSLLVVGMLIYIIGSAARRGSESNDEEP